MRPQLILLAVTGLFCAAVMDFVVRRLPDSEILLMRPSEIPGVAYQLVPGSTAKMGRHSYKINSWGFRYREIPKEKPQGTFRVVAVGASLIFGQGTEKNDMAATLEAKLDAKPPKGYSRVEVINAGVPSFTTCQELPYLKSYLDAFAPDLVVVAHTVISPELAHVPFGLDLETGKIPAAYRAYHWLKQKVFLLKWLVYKISPIIVRLKGKNYGPSGAADEIRYTELLHDPKGPYWPRCAECMTGFGAYQADKKVPVLFLVFPLLNRLDSPVLAPIYGRVVAHIRAQGMDAIDFHSIFKGLPAETYAAYSLKADGQHLTEPGHVFAAERIYARLLAQPGLLAGRGRFRR